METVDWKRFDLSCYWNSFNVGFTWFGHDYWDDQGITYMGWELNINLGPWTLCVNGRERNSE